MRDLVIRWFLLLFAFGCQQSAGSGSRCIRLLHGGGMLGRFLGGLPEVTCDGEVLFGISSSRLKVDGSPLVELVACDYFEWHRDV